MDVYTLFIKLQVFSLSGLHFIRSSLYQTFFSLSDLLFSDRLSQLFSWWDLLFIRSFLCQTFFFLLARKLSKGWCWANHIISVILSLTKLYFVLVEVGWKGWQFCSWLFLQVSVCPRLSSYLYQESRTLDSLQLEWMGVGFFRIMQVLINNN